MNMLTRDPDPVARLEKYRRPSRPAPEQVARRALVEQLEQDIAAFLESSLPGLDAAALAPFDEAARAALLDLTPSDLTRRLREQSERARHSCQRYEREFDIYRIAEGLPHLQDRLSEAQAGVDRVRRQLDRLDVELEPLTALNQTRSAAGQEPVSFDTAGQFARRRGWRHTLALLLQPDYRRVRRVLDTLEQDGERIREKLLRRTRLQLDLLVREQEAEVLRDEFSRQRGWVEAFVTAWTGRLNDAQILAALRQAVADQLHDPACRAEVARRFADIWPASVDRLFAEISRMEA